MPLPAAFPPSAAPAPVVPASLPPSPMAGFTGTVANRAHSPVVTYSRKPQAATRAETPVMMKPAAAVASPMMANGNAAAIAVLNSTSAALQRATLPKPDPVKVRLFLTSIVSRCITRQHAYQRARTSLLIAGTRCYCFFLSVFSSILSASW